MGTTIRQIEVEKLKPILAIGQANSFEEEYEKYQ